MADSLSPETGSEAPPRIQLEDQSVADNAAATMMAQVNRELPAPPAATPAAGTGRGDRDTPVTNLRGGLCRPQPGEGQVPVLESGARTNGCTYRGAGDLLRPRPQSGSGSDQPPEFNTAQLYTTAQDQTVHMSVKSSPPRVRTPQTIDTGGSGVIIGKSDSECFVATANHVVEGIPGGTMRSRSATTRDGSSFPVEVRHSDPGKDIAVVALQTGAATDRVCKPATFAENSNFRGPGVAFGFPEETRTLYASPGTIKDVTTFRGLLERLGTRVDPRDRTKDDMTRPMVVFGGQTRGGQSGGPVYTADGQVTGLVQGGSDRRTFGATVLTAPMVRDLLEKVQRRPR